MRKAIACLSVGALAIAVALSVRAAELKSGLQPGETVGAFTVEKCAGAANDGKESGSKFCYRCMLGAKPVVMVFARKADSRLADLVKEINTAISKNSDQKLSSFVNLIGPDAAALKKEAKDFAAKHELQNVALVVPEENENGPAEFKVSPDAEFTVVLYREGKVAANHALPAGKLDSKEIASIIADTSKILK